MEWQPIETAPKDGTKIDLWTVRKPIGTSEFFSGKTGRICDAHWSFSTDMKGNALVDPIFDGWSLDGCSGQSYMPNKISGEATHWMPLPAPPSNAGGNATERSEGRVDHNVGRLTPGEE
jgi:hypothetical protein